MISGCETSDEQKEESFTITKKISLRRQERIQWINKLALFLEDIGQEGLREYQQYQALEGNQNGFL